MSISFSRQLIFMSLLVLLIILFSLALGRYPLTLWQVIYTLLEPLAIFKHPINDIERQIIWSVRLPRILLAFVAGAGLALSGAALQGLFHNPLVDPHIIGVSSGAAFGGTLAILIGLTPLLLLLTTFSCGLLALLLVFLVNKILIKQHNLTLILAGMVLSAFFAALVSLLQYIADSEEKLPTIVFWLLGSFATANWHKLLLILPVMAVASILLLKLRWQLNILSLGQHDAQRLGIAVVKVRWIILLLCAALVACQVAVSGAIGWVGLLIPHLARMLVGADHCKLLPTAFIIGGCYLVLVDDIARLASSAEIPLGIITALLGAPVFIWLLRLTQHRSLI